MPGMAQEDGTGFGIFGASECDADGPSMPTSHKKGGFRAVVGLENVARRTLGIAMLLTTVFLWTTSNFLASVGALVELYCAVVLIAIAVHFC